MRKFWMTLAVAASAGLFLAGCGGGQKAAETGGGASMGEQAAAVDQDAAPEGASAETGGRMVKAPEGTETASVTLAGTIGCGHCTYGVTHECALAMKTAEGTVYLIENDPEHEAHMAERFSGRPVTVTGTVAQTDTANVVFAEKVELR